jgi:hypothetical protein
MTSNRSLPEPKRRKATLSTLEYPGCPASGTGALDLPAGTATTGTLFAVPRNDSLPVSDVPARDTGAGSVVVVVELDVDPDVTLDDDRERDEVPEGPAFAEQALRASTTASSTVNAPCRETKLVR